MLPTGWSTLALIKRGRAHMQCGQGWASRLIWVGVVEGGGGCGIATLNIHSQLATACNCLQMFLGKVSMMVNWNPKCKTQ